MYSIKKIRFKKPKLKYMMTQKIPPPILFWIISALLLFWSLADAAVFAMDLSVPRQKSLNINDSLARLETSRPLWYVLILGFAVVTGLFASVCLLIRNKIAVLLASLTLVAVIIDVAASQFSSMQEDPSTYDWDLLYMVLFFDLVLVIFSVYSKKRNWIV
jgi:hypothetical protein